MTKQKQKRKDELVLILLPSYKISSEGVITPHHNTNNRPHEMIIISQNIALRFEPNFIYFRYGAGAVVFR